VPKHDLDEAMHANHCCLILASSSAVQASPDVNWTECEIRAEVQEVIHRALQIDEAVFPFAADSCSRLLIAARRAFFFALIDIIIVTALFQQSTNIQGHQ